MNGQLGKGIITFFHVIQDFHYILYIVYSSDHWKHPFTAACAGRFTMHQMSKLPQFLVSTYIGYKKKHFMYTKTLKTQERVNVN